MNLLSRISILNKIGAVIALIAVIVGSCIWYAQMRMSAIDVAYSQFFARESRGVDSARRLNRLIFELNYYVYRTIAETDAEQIKQANAGFVAALPNVDKTLKILRQQAPDFATRIDEQAERLARFVSGVTEVRRLASLNQNDQAIDLVHRTIDPTFDALATAGMQLGDDIGKYLQEGADNLSNQTQATRWNLMVSSALGMLVGLGAAIAIVILGITRPVAGLVAVLQRMARGEIDAEIKEAARRDEIGAVGRAVDGIKTMVAQKAAEQAEIKRIADTATAAARRRTMIDLADDFERAVGGIVGQVSSSATELQATAEQMTSTASQAASQSTNAAVAAEEASTNVGTVATAAEELGASVQEIGRQVSGSADLAQVAVTESDETARLVHELSQAATKVGDVVSLISSIAGQTNLLALNATIEAARAGEAGRGFAVVATEVKELASQTARATGEISSQISQIQGATGQAVRAIGTISGRIREINAVATTIAAAVEEQGAATQEIVRNVSQASAGTSEVTRNIAGVAGAAEETGAAAAQVLASASELSRQSEHLGSEVQRFLATVRAA
ncbi:methyl-accepting chemotaxis protein [Methylobacterium soli]|uniref:HAMP domain-containing protein n=2 Tax=Methylobacterium soli TaxID=553447 RepID=A0A6L3T6J3_9HYPH|nr:methyl-accepting chemotaxis protein [Methylobacterium soli]KAB1080995.1 HAMP domain-containing protein [Methylobacterium soli]